MARWCHLGLMPSWPPQFCREAYSFSRSFHLPQVKKMLKLTKGWEEARDHALIVSRVRGGWEWVV